MLMLRRPDLSAAQSRFDRYFELRPDAKDRQTITDMMEGLASKRRR